MIENKLYLWKFFEFHSFVKFLNIHLYNEINNLHLDYSLLKIYHCKF